MRIRVVDQNANMINSRRTTRKKTTYMRTELPLEMNYPSEIDDHIHRITLLPQISDLMLILQ